MVNAATLSDWLRERMDLEYPLNCKESCKYRCCYFKLDFLFSVCFLGTCLFLSCLLFFYMFFFFFFCQMLNWMDWTLWARGNNNMYSWLSGLNSESVVLRHTQPLIDCLLAHFNTFMDQNYCLAVVCLCTYITDRTFCLQNVMTSQDSLLLSLWI